LNEIPLDVHCHTCHDALNKPVWREMTALHIPDAIRLMPAG
jgi:hypothetical protein